MSFNVYVTRQIPEEGINLLKKFCQTVEVNPHDRPLTYDELLRQVKGQGCYTYHAFRQDRCTHDE